MHFVNSQPILDSRQSMCEAAKGGAVKLRVIIQAGFIVFEKHLMNELSTATPSLGPLKGSGLAY